MVKFPQGRVLFAAIGIMFAGITLGQAPVVTALENNYSYMLPGLPNYGIAQGAIFDIFGTNLSLGSTPLQSVPLQTTLNGVSINVTVNGTTVPLLLYYTTPGQIAAILPSRTPAGTGQLIVTTNRQVSAPFPIQVVQSAFGILTLNGIGSGAAALFDTSSNYVGFTNAANPGDYITIWGTGVGPAPGDESVTQTPQDLTNVPIEVDIGGVPATVAYHGRSAYPGLDQINVVVPAGVQGCFVSMVVRSGNFSSNFASLPVAASGRTCADPIFGLSSSLIQTLSGLGTFGNGNIGFGRGTITGQFRRTINSNLSATTLFNGTGASLGSCMVYNINAAGTVGLNDPNLSVGVSAGAALNISGPAGNATLNNNSNLYFGHQDNSFVPDAGGTFTFDNGSGAPEVGPFSVKLNLPAPLIWTNQNNLGLINRSQGVTVTWTGGDPNSHVTVSGSTTATSGPPVGATFSCSAPASAQRLTVPAAVLLSLPSGSSTLSVGNAPSTVVFQNTSGTKLDFGLLNSGWGFSTNVVYQ